MKITNVEIFDCEVSRTDPRMARFNPVLIRINTDEGISGIGEVGLAYGAGAKAGVGIVRDLAPRIIGKDPMKVEAIWENLFRATFWGMGGGNVFYAGMSAIDIALWDIRGKALRAPVYQLLGGKTNERLRAYASQLQFGWSDTHQMLTRPEQYADAARKAVSQGYTAIKVDPLQVDRNGGPPLDWEVNQNYFGLLRADQLRMGEERIAAMREAVGPDVDIIIEAHALLGVNAAIQFARAVEPYNILFYEEPVHPLNMDNMAMVARNTSIPIATGERCYTRWGYRDLFEKQAVAVIQPDICLCGGLTEAKKICDYANLYDATMQAHICGGPVSTAAALHLEAAVPNFIIHEHHTHSLKDCVRELCIHDYQPERGDFSVPDLPGLGQELNDDVVKRYHAFTIE
ncbi:mandelate racemase/muconate lactonizing enzyme family protein [Caballeronia sp. LZ008]|uniref:mandelate racemase/muconate lactonizing enzyme family protein n=1 Tax=unclassified Caballeronia TaxID=2646786 RepID=UPI002028BF1A|nr:MULTISPECIES: mandelate racemase/muconate lactonizing enzyme family protein [unclassified Caballeronia]MDR5796173.1 mandelate racemase/muconate lactonizing enzyme family protein [Caballeronia sp. LZ008]